MLRFETVLFVLDNNYLSVTIMDPLLKKLSHEVPIFQRPDKKKTQSPGLLAAGAVFGSNPFIGIGLVIMRSLFPLLQLRLRLLFSFWR